jgi:hypothetical protein
MEAEIEIMDANKYKRDVAHMRREIAAMKGRIHQARRAMKEMYDVQQF